MGSKLGIIILVLKIPIHGTLHVIQGVLYTLNSMSVLINSEGKGIKPIFKIKVLWLHVWMVVSFFLSLFLARRENPFGDDIYPSLGIIRKEGVVLVSGADQPGVLMSFLGSDKVHLGKGNDTEVVKTLHRFFIDRDRDPEARLGDNICHKTATTDLC